MDQSPYFSIKKTYIYVVVLVLILRLDKVILMSTHNIGFYGEFQKFVPISSSNTHVICLADKQVEEVILSQAVVYVSPGWFRASVPTLAAEGHQLICRVGMVLQQESHLKPLLSKQGLKQEGAHLPPPS